MTNPVLASDLRTLFSHPPHLRGLALLVAGSALILALWWPRSALAWSLRSGNPPQTLTAVALGALGLLLVLNARFGIDDQPPAGATPLSDLAALTPAPLGGLVAGRVLSGLLHVLVQLALVSPLLLASRAIAGMPPSSLLAILAVLGAWTLAARGVGLLLRLLLDAHELLRSVILLATAAGYLGLTAAFLPEVNPVHALLESSGATGAVPRTPLSFSASSAIIGILVAAGCTAVCWAVLRRARLDAVRHGRRHGDPGTNPS